MKPLLKWVGGKSKLIPYLEQYIPTNISKYFEPFFGGGAFYFHIQPKRGYISDSNEDLINTYVQIRDNTFAFCKYIEKLNNFNNRHSYFAIRDMFNERRLSLLHRAAIFLYMNAFGFHGLCRYNGKGKFNVPPHPMISKRGKINIGHIKEIAKVLMSAEQLDSYDYSAIGNMAHGTNEFILLDPPYIPLDATSNFTSYTKDGFDFQDHQSLKKLVDKLTKQKIRVMVFNNDLKIVHKMYSKYTIIKVPVLRRIAAKKGKKSCKLYELAIINYGNDFKVCQ